jgi:glycosyltransferase involved in cell wall biosynthesis
MRILLANTGHPSAIKGGAEAAVLDLAHALARRGHSVALVVHHGGRELTLDEDEGVRVYALPNRNLYFAFDGTKRPAPLRLAWHALDGANPLMAAAFGEVLEREKPDVVNTHVLAGLSQLVWREAYRRAIPIVHYLHEYGAMCPRGSGVRDGRLCTSPCLPCGVLTVPRKRLSRLVDTVVGVSRFTLERHLAWGFFPEAARAVIPNIFTGLAFTPRTVPADAPLRLGYFGRLIPDKGALSTSMRSSACRRRAGRSTSPAPATTPTWRRLRRALRRMCASSAGPPPPISSPGSTRSSYPRSGPIRSRASCSRPICMACR